MINLAFFLTVTLKRLGQVSAKCSLHHIYLLGMKTMQTSAQDHLVKMSLCHGNQSPIMETILRPQSGTFVFIVYIFLYFHVLL